jgi:hypothetical protein
MIFVDPLRNYGWRLGPSCHMTTDGDQEELHRFAAAVGLKRSWFQPWPKSSIDHYDLTASRRAKAVELGARELTSREAYQHWKIWQANRRLLQELDG